MIDNVRCVFLLGHRVEMKQNRTILNIMPLFMQLHQGRRAEGVFRGPDPPASNRTTHEIHANTSFLDGWSIMKGGVVMVNRPFDLDPLVLKTWRRHWTEFTEEWHYFIITVINQQYTVSLTRCFTWQTAVKFVKFVGQIKPPPHWIRCFWPPFSGWPQILKYVPVWIARYHYHFSQTNFKCSADKAGMNSFHLTKLA